MRFHLAVFALILALSAEAVAACRGPQGLSPPGAAVPLVEGQFRYNPDKGLGCVVSAEQGAAMGKHEQAVSFLSCLRVGVVSIGDRMKAVEALLGEPVATSDLGVFSQSRLYEVPQKGALRPHYVLTYRDDQVVAVQLIGPPMRFPAYFSGLTLGDEQQKVIDTLGPPGQRCQSRPDRPELWTWPAFPIAIDIIDGYVAGVKVTWPEGK